MEERARGVAAGDSTWFSPIKKKLAALPQAGPSAALHSLRRKQKQIDRHWDQLEAGVGAAK